EARRDPEPEARRAAAARRVERSRQQGRALEMVARAELDLAVEVAPVLGEAGELVPLLRERLARGSNDLGGATRAEQLERSVDPLLVEAGEQAADEFGGRAGASPCGVEADAVVEAAGVERRE